MIEAVYAGGVDSLRRRIDVCGVAVREPELDDALRRLVQAPSAVVIPRRRREARDRCALVEQDPARRGNQGVARNLAGRRQEIVAVPLDERGIGHALEILRMANDALEEGEVGLHAEDG